MTSTSAPRRCSAPASRARRPRPASCCGSARSRSTSSPSRASSASGRMTAAPLIGQPADVQRLVVLGLAGPRHEHGRGAGDGDLGDGRCSAAADQQVGGGVEQLDAVVVADDAVDDAAGRVDDRGAVEEAVADDLAAPPGRCPPPRSATYAGDRGVERRRALRATGHGDDEAVDGQVEPAAGVGAVGRAVDGEDPATDRRPRDDGSRQRRVGEGDGRRGGEAGRQLRWPGRAGGRS